MQEGNRFFPFSKSAFDLLRELMVYNPEDRPVCFARMLSGGYIVFRKALSGIERIYSYGVDINNVVFDLSITRKLKLLCHCYKSTLEAPPENNNFLVFHKREIGDSFGTFSDHVKENGDEGKNILLKVDMEVGGWAFLEGVTEQDFKFIPQIVVEHHEMLFHDQWSRYTKILNKINQYYYLCYIQALNTDYEGIIFDDKIYLHTKYAATYIRKDLGKCSINTKISFPTRVEYPNITKRPYVPLDAWPYRSDRKGMYSMLAIVKLARLRSFLNGMRDDVPLKKWMVKRVGDKMHVNSEDVSYGNKEIRKKRVSLKGRKGTLNDLTTSIAKKVKAVQD